MNRKNVWPIKILKVAKINYYKISNTCTIGRWNQNVIYSWKITSDRYRIDICILLILILFLWKEPFRQITGNGVLWNFLKFKSENNHRFSFIHWISSTHLGIIHVSLRNFVKSSDTSVSLTHGISEIICWRFFFLYFLFVLR